MRSFRSSTWYKFFFLFIPKLVGLLRETLQTCSFIAVRGQYGTLEALTRRKLNLATVSITGATAFHSPSQQKVAWVFSGEL